MNITAAYLTVGDEIIVDGTRREIAYASAGANGTEVRFFGYPGTWTVSNSEEFRLVCRSCGYAH